MLVINLACKDKRSSGNNDIIHVKQRFGIKVTLFGKGEGLLWHVFLYHELGAFFRDRPTINGGFFYLGQCASSESIMLVTFFAKKLFPLSELHYHDIKKWKNESNKRKVIPRDKIAVPKSIGVFYQQYLVVKGVLFLHHVVRNVVQNSHRSLTPNLKEIVKYLFQ